MEMIDNLGFWTKFAVIIGVVMGGITLAWIMHKGARPDIKERIFTGLVATVIIMIGLVVMTSGILLKPETLMQEIALIVIGTLMLSALASTIAIILYRRTYKTKRR